MKRATGTLRCPMPSTSEGQGGAISNRHSSSSWAMETLRQIAGKWPNHL